MFLPARDLRHTATLKRPVTICDSRRPWCWRSAIRQLPAGVPVSRSMTRGEVAQWVYGRYRKLIRLFVITSAVRVVVLMAGAVAVTLSRGDKENVTASAAAFGIVVVRHRRTDRVAWVATRHSGDALSGALHSWIHPDVRRVDRDGRPGYGGQHSTMGGGGVVLAVLRLVGVRSRHANDGVRPRATRNHVLAPMISAIAFDLDDTLAPSKSRVPDELGHLLHGDRPAHTRLRDLGWCVPPVRGSTSGRAPRSARGVREPSPDAHVRDEVLRVCIRTLGDGLLRGPDGRRGRSRHGGARTRSEGPRTMGAGRADVRRAHREPRLAGDVLRARPGGPGRPQARLGCGREEARSPARTHPEGPARPRGARGRIDLDRRDAPRHRQGVRDPRVRAHHRRGFPGTSSSWATAWSPGATTFLSLPSASRRARSPGPTTPRRSRRTSSRASAQAAARVPTPLGSHESGGDRGRP